MKIYCDHSATTYMDKRVLDEMMPYLTDIFGNASSQHFYGREACKGVDIARAKIAKALNCKPTEVYFTSGGTEADNWAIKGTAMALQDKGNHIITSAIEHPAVIDTCHQLEKQGFDVTYLPVDTEGFVSLTDLENAITDKTILITIMTANNEIGSIQPFAQIGAIAKAHNIYFHTDAVQAVGSLDIDVERDNIDMLSMSGHKFYGPKGVGVLYKSNKVKIAKFMTGGEQERNQRASTTNTPSIVGMAKALELAVGERDKNNAHNRELRDYFVQEVEKNIKDVRFNGTRDFSKRLSNNANFSFEFIEGEALLLRLDLKGIAVSSGSACSSGSLDPSHVLLAIKVPIELAHGSLRFSFGKCNTKEQVDFIVENLKNIVNDLRVLSPLFKEIKGVEIHV
ncbi:MAG: cysteine desulfurase NifS [Clostridia bacterium]